METRREGRGVAENRAVERYAHGADSLSGSVVDAARETGAVRWQSCDRSVDYSGGQQSHADTQAELHRDDSCVPAVGADSQQAERSDRPESKAERHGQSGAVPGSDAPRDRAKHG